jgi:hypothetical protein
MNKIQEIFFENMKQIFNSYNQYLDQIDKEKKSQLLEINKHMEDNAEILVKLDNNIYIYIYFF